MVTLCVCVCVCGLGLQAAAEFAREVHEYMQSVELQDPLPDAPAGRCPSIPYALEGLARFPYVR